MIENVLLVTQDAKGNLMLSRLILHSSLVYLVLNFALLKQRLNAHNTERFLNSAQELFLKELSLPLWLAHPELFLP